MERCIPSLHAVVVGTSDDELAAAMLDNVLAAIVKRLGSKKGSRVQLVET